MEDDLFPFFQKDFPSFVGILVSVRDMGFHSIVSKDSGFLGYDTVSLG